MKNESPLRLDEGTDLFVKSLALIRCRVDKKLCQCRVAAGLPTDEPGIVARFTLLKEFDDLVIVEGTRGDHRSEIEKRRALPSGDLAKERPRQEDKAELSSGGGRREQGSPLFLESGEPRSAVKHLASIDNKAQTSV
jgi:hypothetical protein